MTADITLQIIRTARDKFGISALKPYQILVMQRIMEQENGLPVRNQIVILPTGTGKSICFLVPAVLCRGLTVIVYPLLALMNDQISKLDKAGIPSICIHGGQSRQERQEMFRSLDNGTRIVVTTAESLQNPSVLEELKRHRISLFVVDEAHVISQWGHEFRPAYLSLSYAIRLLGPNQILAFTATASEETLKDIRAVLFPRKPLVVRGDADRPNIVYGSYPTLNRMQGLVDIARVCKRPAIVFCRTRVEAQNTCEYLMTELHSVPVRYYHAGLTTKERTDLEKWFMESPDGILCATSAYGMGMDKGNIRTVIHYRLPQNVEEYLQESGRAGRDGNTSTAWTIVTLSDMKSQKPYSPILDIFTQEKCRRIALLERIGQEKNECSGCDVCLKRTITNMNADLEIRSLVRKWPFRFDSRTAAYTLLSSRNISSTGLQNIANPLYGSVKGWNAKLLGRTISYLSEDNVDYPIKSVRFMDYGYLLYPADNIIYTGFARLLRRIDNGYRWIVRKKRRRKSSTEENRGTGEKPQGSV